jgi:serine/threonine protein kinase
MTPTAYASRPDSLANLVEELTAKLQAGERIDAEALARDHPEHAEQLARLLPALELLADLSRSGDARLPPAGAGADEPSAGGVLGDFRILREVGRGGMGVVYEAEQLSLRRRVALKVLPFAATMDERHLRRFLNEAQAAAHLHHPNIVPVYAVGCERGVHYYAMQFIDGRTLADLIRDRDRPAAPEDATGPYPPAPAVPAPEGPTRPAGALSTEPAGRGREFFRSAARLGIQAAEALEYAHATGIVHRDVKPGNLMVDGRGRLWVTDFGLARFDAGPHMTVSGDVLGTLRYMSPEQALAKHGLVDHRTDVYSLGVTLYELMAGEPAFAGPDRQEILRQIAFEEPRPPRRLDRTVPRELETVVLKAMAKAPTARYAAAGELADDLQRWLDDRPIRARPPTLGQRARRWARRHPAAVAAAAVVLAVSLLAAFLVLWREKEWSDRQAAAATAAQEEEARAHQRADANADLAWQAADDMYTQVAERWLAHQPRLEPVQREFLLKALRFFERYAHENGSNPAVRLELGKALSRVGKIQSHLGEYRKAEDADRRAIAVFTQLVEELPGEPDLRHDLAACHANLGGTLYRMSRYPEAERAYQQAVGRFASLVAEFPRAIDYRHGLAGTHQNLGTLLGDADRPAEALTVLRRAKDLYQQLTDANPAEAGYRYGLSLTMNNLGVTFRQLGRLRDAEQAWRDAFKLRERLVAESPAVPLYRYGLAESLSNLAAVFADTGRYREAEQAFREALGHQEKLANDFPSVTQYRHEVAVCHNHLGLALTKLDRRADAEKEHRAGRDVLTGLTAQFPEVPEHRRMLAQCHFNLGHLMLISGRLPEAEEAFGQALVLQTALAEADPDRANYRGELADTHCNLAHLFEARGRPAEAERAFRQSVARYTQVVDKLPQEFNSQSRLGAVLNDLALLLRKRGEVAEPRELLERAVKHQQAAVAINPADQTSRRYLKNHLMNLVGVLQESGEAGQARLEDAFRRCCSVLEELVRDFPEVPEYRSELGGTLNDLGALLRERGELAEARRLLEQAIVHQKAALQSDQRHPTYRQFLVNHYWQLAMALVQSGDHRAAAETARELALVSPKAPTPAYEAAGILARCMPLADRDTKLSAEQRKQLARSYGDRAIESLREAVRRGFQDAERLKKDRDLEPLRSRDDFKTLVNELELPPN